MRSSTPSWTDSESEREDAISPCQPEKQIKETSTCLEIDDASPSPEQTRQQTAAPLTYHAHSQLGASPHGSRRCSTDSTVDVHGLWNAMLEIQHRYNCYKSTRMQIAAESDEAPDLMPSRACMDILNDSIEDLPAEGWQILDRYLGPNESKARRSTRWKFWKHQ